MKKYLFMIVMVLCSAGAIAQVDTPETTKVSTEINAVVNNIFNKTTEAVKGMADALKVPAEHVYTIIVKQQVIRSLSYLGILIVAILVAFVGYKVTKYGFAKDDEDDNHNRFYYNEALIPAAVFSALISLILFIVFCIQLPEVLTGFFNPEYGAIQEIAKLIR